jgi:phage terminase small subunit
MTSKQTRFVSEYLIDLNATKAAIRAGYSRKTAKSIGQENLTKPDIFARISACQEVLFARNAITADNVLQELARLAFFDVRDLFAPDGSMIPIHKLSRDAAAAIKGFELVQVEIPKRVLRGIRTLGRWEGMYLFACRLAGLSEKERKIKRAEFAEIYASILNGFAAPYKKEPPRAKQKNRPSNHYAATTLLTE